MPYPNCKECVDELYQDCNGRLRCENCDLTCPACYSGNVEQEDDQDYEEEDYG